MDYFWQQCKESIQSWFPPFVHWGPAESKIKMAVVLRAPWGMSLKLEFDPLFMVTWDNQPQQTWKLISFQKYDMPLTLSVWIQCARFEYFKIPLDVTLSSRIQTLCLVLYKRYSTSKHFWVFNLFMTRDKLNYSHQSKMLINWEFWTLLIVINRNVWNPVLFNY